MSTSKATPAAARPTRFDPVVALPLAAVCLWWIRDLSFQWSSLVDYRFGWIVVLLAGFLTWERWPTRPAEDRPIAPLWPVLIALPGVGLILLGELYKLGVARTAAASLSLSIGCALFLAAILLGACGPRTFRHFLFPIAFFFVAVPMPKLLWNPVVFGLQSVISVLNVETLGIMGIPAERQGHIIRMGDVLVGVNEACSGVRSLQSSIMAALFVGDLTLRRRGLKVLFLIFGIGLAIFGNYIRSLYLSWTAFRSGTDQLRAIHDSAGWSVLLFTFIGVVLLSLFMTRMETLIAARNAAEDEADDETTPETP